MLSFTKIDIWTKPPVVWVHLGEEWVVFEREPNIRMHFAGEKAPVSPHTDSRVDGFNCVLLKKQVGNTRLPSLSQGAMLWLSIYVVAK